MPECESETTCDNCGEVELVSGTFVSDKGDLIVSGKFCSICEMFEFTDDFIHEDFEKQYTAWKNCESIRDTAHKDGIAFGQQNPDPKQYANRKDLVEEIERELTIGSADGTFTMPSLEYRRGLNRAIELIRTHKKEE